MRSSLKWVARPAVPLASAVVMSVWLASPALAINACAAGPVANGSQCAIDTGFTISIVIKGGNGGAGGTGGIGGTGGTGNGGLIAGGTGGAGGPGGNGGAGAKWSGTYTNTTGALAILTFTIGANGGAGGTGATGATGSNGGAGVSGGTGGSGGGGFGGNGGGDSLVDVGGITVASALGGDGGSGGQGGAGGQGGQVGGGPTGNGSVGNTGANGADGAGSNVTTTWLEAPFIELTSNPYVIVPHVDAADTELTPPTWYQSYKRTGEAECATGWNPGWAWWPNNGTGGPVCNRDVLWRGGQWVAAADPDSGPFTPYTAS